MLDVRVVCQQVVCMQLHIGGSLSALCTLPAQVGSLVVSLLAVFALLN